jgi:predicted ATPase
VAFIAALRQMVEQDSQFIIALPGATIWSFDGGTIHLTEYEQIEHVKLTRDFLLNPRAFLRHLE